MSDLYDNCDHDGVHTLLLNETKFLYDKIKKLEQNNKKLTRALYDQKKIIWMAAEYAKSAKIFAPFLVNKAIDSLKECNIDIQCDYVKDKFIGNWK
jgi:hypothetical protein